MGDATAASIAPAFEATASLFAGPCGAEASAVFAAPVFDATAALLVGGATFSALVVDDLVLGPYYSVAAMIFVPGAVAAMIFVPDAVVGQVIP
jgi:hypothetical protein